MFTMMELTTPVRRCLFGQPSDESRDIFFSLISDCERRDVVAFKQKYGFDISNQGESENERDNVNNDENSYEWVDCTADCNVPSFYKRGYGHKCTRRSVCSIKRYDIYNRPDADDGKCATRIPGSSSSCKNGVQFTMNNSTELYIGRRLLHSSPLRPANTSFHEDSLFSTLQPCLLEAGKPACVEKSFNVCSSTSKPVTRLRKSTTNQTRITGKVLICFNYTSKV